MLRPGTAAWFGGRVQTPTFVIIDTFVGSVLLQLYLYKHVATPRHPRQHLKHRVA